jgi:hypothetical protein
MPEAFGYFTLNRTETGGSIWIRDSMDTDTTLATLCEEWAHARTYTLDDHTLDDPHHHPAFWSELGRIQAACRDVSW